MSNPCAQVAHAGHPVTNEVLLGVMAMLEVCRDASDEGTRLMLLLGVPSVGPEQPTESSPHLPGASQAGL